jgi:Tol biopolymer transport system component
MVVVLAAVVFWPKLGKIAEGPSEPLQLRPLTTYPGQELNPSFSPDGREVVFGWNGEKRDNWDIYITQIGGAGLSRITDHLAQDRSPVWSPDGQTIAFVRSFADSKSDIRLVPSRGGPERKLAEVLSPAPLRALSWFPPDGQWLAVSAKADADQENAIYLMSLETGEMSSLVSPGVYDQYSPAFSPDGRTLAFVWYAGAQLSQVFLLPISADLKPTDEPRQLTQASGEIVDLAWSLDGRQILFISGPPWELYRVSVTDSGPATLLPFAGENLLSLALSPQGGRLALTKRLPLEADIYRAPLPGSGSGALITAFEPEKFISSSRRDAFPRYSPDGSRIAFTSERSGNRESWLCDSEGNNPQQLTFFGGPPAQVPDWSPDGRWICFSARPEGNVDIYVVRSEGGAPRRLTTHPSGDGDPRWSPDGEWIYFRSDRSGEPQIWRIPAEGGQPEQITKDGGIIPVGQDRLSLYYTRAAGEARSLWKVPAGGGQETEVLESVFNKGSAVEDGVYFTPGAGRPDTGYLQFYDFASGEITTVLRGFSSNSGYCEVSPDGRWVLTTQSPEPQSDIMLVENFQ